MAIDPSVLEGAQIAAAGGAGGALRAFLSPELSFRDGAITTFFGAVVSYYCTHVAVGLLVNSPNVGQLSAGGLLVGLVGISVARTVLKLNWRDIVLRFIPQSKVD
jgi:hypothetical protein